MKHSDRFIALSYPDFRLIWIGLLISNIGSQMQLIALNWHVYLLTNSTIALGMIGLSRFLPIAFFSLLGGSVSDSYNRKKIQLITQTVLTLLSLLLSITTFTGTIHPVLIYVVTALSAIAISFDTPARQAIIPSLIDKKYLENAMSLNTIMFQTSLIVGPMLGGFVIAQFGLGFAYIFNAISFLAVITALLFIKASGAIEGKIPPVSFTAIKEGLVFVRSKTILWSTMLLDFFSTFFASAVTLMPVFARDILHVGPQGMGLLYAAPAIGAVGVGITIAGIGTIKHQGKVLLTGIGFFALGTIVFGLSKEFLISFLALVVIGAGDSLSTIIRNTIRQIVTPDHLRGRMISIMMIFFFGGPQLGEFQMGLLASKLGPHSAVVIGGLSTLTVASIMAWKIPVLRRYKGHTTKDTRLPAH